MENKLEHLAELTSHPTGEKILINARLATVIERVTEKYHFEDNYDPQRFKTRIFMEKEAFFVQETPLQIKEIINKETK